jgi:hypothetical protein
MRFALAIPLVLLAVPLPRTRAVACKGERPECDAIEAAIANLRASPDPVCRRLGDEAARRFADPHSWYARIDTEGSGFVRIDEPTHRHEGAPTVNGVNYVHPSGPRLAGSIARHEAAGLRLADSASMSTRCE